MKIVIAPQAFKGSLSATGVATAMALGLRRVLPNAEIIQLPLADGGEGTVETLVLATGGRRVTAIVSGPLGDPVEAEWGILGDGTAIIETAAASGIGRLPADRLNPLLTSSYGTGQLIREALETGCTEIIVGLGGSATNDAGAGIAQALGASLLDEHGEELPRGGAALSNLRHIDVSAMDKRLASVRVVVACDVTNPLLGSNGASWIYGPQKGATTAMCRQLDDALANFAVIAARDLGLEVADIPGAGAAGGLGAGLTAFLDATLVPGVDIICDAVKLTGHLKGADLVLTGEGRLDDQTLSGKTIAGVACRAQALGIPVIAIAGQVPGDMAELYRLGISAALSIAPGPITLQEALRDAAPLIADATERAIRLVLIEPPGSLPSDR